jgi:phage terminase small subunit
MPGRHAKPISLHILEGNKSHKTKEEIEQRQSSEIRIGTSELKTPVSVKKNPIARKKWNELVTLFDGIEFVSSSDIGALAQLCLAYSELDSLINDLNIISNMPEFSLKEEFEIASELENNLGSMAAKKMWEKIEFIMSAAGKLPFNKAIDSKRKIIQSYEDRFFLNAVAKLKNIPKSSGQKSQETPLQKAGFGFV